MWGFKLIEFKMKHYILILICAFATFKAACQTIHHDSMEYSSVRLDKDDRIFLALKDTAQKHLSLFISNLNKYGTIIRHIDLL